MQRQLRETQELIKADCSPSPLYGAFQQGGTSNASALRSQTRTGNLRRPTLETQYSVGNSELS